MEPYAVEMEVRDYELDMHGIVDDSVYPRYFEHGRHKFLNHIGANFEEMTRKEIFFTNVQITIKYKIPLRYSEIFKVTTTFRRQGKLRFIFDQRIINADEKVSAEAEVTGVCLNSKGRPFLPDEILKIFDGYITE